MKKTLTYKTNIKCNGCIATVTPFFKKNEAIKKWSVDLESPDRVLTIEMENGEIAEIESLIKEAGYEAESII
jgi:copper chaperone